MKRITFYCDGACEPCNPSGIGVSAAIAFEGDVRGAAGAQRPEPLIAKYAEIGRGAGMTNNRAEYAAVRWALRWSVKNIAHCEIVVFTDSQLVVRQINGEWACNKDHLRIFRDECRELIKELPYFRLEWVRRELNDVADELTKRGYAEAIQREPFRR
jgi:ribonuclease HI